MRKGYVAENVLPSLHVDNLQATIASYFVLHAKKLSKADIMYEAEKIDDCFAKSLDIEENIKEPPEMYRVGEIILFDTPFSQTRELSQGEAHEPACIKRASRNAFKDNVGSQVMVYHHKLVVLREEPNLLL